MKHSLESKVLVIISIISFIIGIWIILVADYKPNLVIGWFLILISIAWYLIALGMLYDERKNYEKIKELVVNNKNDDNSMFFLKMQFKKEHFV